LAGQVDAGAVVDLSKWIDAKKAGIGVDGYLPSVYDPYTLLDEKLGLDLFWRNVRTHYLSDYAARGFFSPASMAMLSLFSAGATGHVA
jgi:hypothetical protein